MDSLTYNDFPFLKELGLSEDNNGCYRDGEWVSNNGGDIMSVNPHNNKNIAKTRLASVQDFNDTMDAIKKEQVRWMKTPGPQRGEIVRQIGDELRKYKT